MLDSFVSGLFHSYPIVQGKKKSGGKDEESVTAVSYFSHFQNL